MVVGRHAPGEELSLQILALSICSLLYKGIEFLPAISNRLRFSFTIFPGVGTNLGRVLEIWH